MPDEFSLDDSELQSTLSEIQNSDTGGASGSEAGVSPPSGASSDGTASPSSATPSEKAVLGQNATPQQVDAWRAMPKSWRKEMEQHWNTSPDPVKQYVHERETQALQGITQYKQVADRWNGAVQPFQQWFDHYQINPTEAFQKLATTHIILKYGKPEDRVQYARMLMQDYGLAPYFQQMAQGQQPTPNQTNEEFLQLQNRLEGFEKREYERELGKKRESVVAFFNDPKNEFAADLKDDILQVLELGAANTLEQAYQIAMWQNPSVRERLMSREIEKATKPPRRGPPNIKPSSVPTSPTDDKDESIDDTMRQALNRINSR